MRNCLKKSGDVVLMVYIKKYNMKIFVSFDFDNDRQYKYTLNMWASNANIDFSFNDGSTQEIQSWNISRIKAAITTKINQSDAILVLVGEHADTPHKDRALIGYRNWQYFEIAQAKAAGKKIIAVKLDSRNSSPSLLYGCGVCWAMSFSLDSIKTAIHKA